MEESRLPREKSLSCFDLSRLSPKARASFNALKDGAFLDRAENVLVFFSAVPSPLSLGQELSRRRTVLYAPPSVV